MRAVLFDRDRRLPSERPGAANRESPNGRGGSVIPSFDRLGIKGVINRDQLKPVNVNDPSSSLVTRSS
jgi:hypothetical protein